MQGYRIISIWEYTILSFAGVYILVREIGHIYFFILAIFMLAFPVYSLVGLVLNNLMIEKHGMIMAFGASLPIGLFEWIDLFSNDSYVPYTFTPVGFSIGWILIIRKIYTLSRAGKLKEIIEKNGL